MTQVQITVSGSQADVTGISRATIADPEGEVGSVGFYVTGRDSRRIGPLAPDRILSGGVYEKDVLLDWRNLTSVQPEVVLLDGTVLSAKRTIFGTRFEPVAASAGAIGSLDAVAQPSRVAVTVTRGTSAIWKCYGKKGALPTVDGTAAAALDERYLRFNENEESARPVLSFSMSVNPGAWNIVAIGYNSAGQPGPRLTAAVQVPA